MPFYDYPKEVRQELVADMELAIKRDLGLKKAGIIRECASDTNTYIRKSAYLIIGGLYLEDKGASKGILLVIKNLYGDAN